MDIELDMKMNKIYSISQKLDWTQLYLNNHVSNEDVGDPLVNWPIQFRSQKCVCQFKYAAYLIWKLECQLVINNVVLHIFCLHAM